MIGGDDQPAIPSRWRAQKWGRGDVKNAHRPG